MAARGEAQADAEVSTLVVSAWRLRWRAPELALVLGERAVALASARRDEVDRLRAESLLVFASNRMGRGVKIADRAMDALKAAEAEAEHETAWRLRVELADSARAVGAPLTGFAAVRPVLEAQGVPDALRASALVQASECLVSVGRGSALAEALAEADRLYSSDPVLDHDTTLLLRGLLRAAAARQHRRWGDLDAAITAAREGVDLLDRLEDPASDSGQVRGRLTVELVCALMDAGKPAEASETGTPFLDRPVRAPSAAPAGWLRLALATRVHLPAGRVDQARDMLRDAADNAERHQLDTLLAESLLALAHVHEVSGDLTEALTNLRSAHAAERRRARAVYAVRARLAAEFAGVHRQSTGQHDQLAALLRESGTTTAPTAAEPNLTPEVKQQLRQWRPVQVHRAEGLRVKRSRRAAEDMTVEGISAARAHAADRWRLVQPFGDTTTPGDQPPTTPHPERGTPELPSARTPADHPGGNPTRTPADTPVTATPALPVIPAIPAVPAVPVTPAASAAPAAHSAPGADAPTAAETAAEAAGTPGGRRRAPDQPSPSARPEEPTPQASPTAPVPTAPRPTLPTQPTPPARSTFPQSSDLDAAVFGRPEHARSGEARPLPARPREQTYLEQTYLEQHFPPPPAFPPPHHPPLAADAVEVPHPAPADVRPPAGEGLGEESLPASLQPDSTPAPATQSPADHTSGDQAPGDQAVGNPNLGNPAPSNLAPSNLAAAFQSAHPAAPAPGSAIESLTASTTTASTTTSSTSTTGPAEFTSQPSPETAPVGEAASAAGDRSVSAAGLIAAAGAVRSGRRRAAREAAGETSEDAVEQVVLPQGSDGGSVLETLKAAGLLDSQRAGGRRRAPDTEDSNDLRDDATGPRDVTTDSRDDESDPAAPPPDADSASRTDPDTVSWRVEAPSRLRDELPHRTRDEAYAKLRDEVPFTSRDEVTSIDMFDSPTMVQPAIRDDDAPPVGLGAAFVKGPVIPTARVPDPPDFPDVTQPAPSHSHPGPHPQPHPGPHSPPLPDPVPDVPEPDQVPPVPIPDPVPQPEPQPQPRPEPEPAVTPNPTPEPLPTSEPNPTPEPAPQRPEPQLPPEPSPISLWPADSPGSPRPLGSPEPLGPPELLPSPGPFDLGGAAHSWAVTGSPSTPRVVSPSGFLGRADVEDDEPIEPPVVEPITAEPATAEPAVAESALVESPAAKSADVQSPITPGAESTTSDQSTSTADSSTGEESGEEPFVTSVIVGGRSIELPSLVEPPIPPESPSAARASRRPKSDLSLAELLAEALVAYEAGRREDEAAQAVVDEAEPTVPIVPVGAPETDAETTAPIRRVTGDAPRWTLPES
ncbi:hypothetical protein AB0I60_16055 [Actinosynnema sp. NPDC050436]|uniref:hypothetical protein n=1 Tax=Actinosynnema sp. NPDC050436 TaxID=3155659 RepID=UPI0033D13ED0